MVPRGSTYITIYWSSLHRNITAHDVYDRAFGAASEG